MRRAVAASRCTWIATPSTALAAMAIAIDPASDQPQSFQSRTNNVAESRAIAPCAKFRTPDPR